METSDKKRLNVVWLVVVAITVVYLWLDHSAEDDGAPAGSVAVTVAAIVLGLVKYRLILRELMDVRRAPRGLRRITDLLVGVIGTALLGAYFVGRAVA